MPTVVKSIPKSNTLRLPKLCCSTPTGMDRKKNHTNTIEGINCAISGERLKSRRAKPVDTPTMSTNPITM